MTGAPPEIAYRTETGLDYFGARYFSGAMGRFTSADPLLASGHAENPQSWNRYSYVLNNPLRMVDPTGMEGEVPDVPETTDCPGPDKPCGQSGPAKDTGPGEQPKSSTDGAGSPGGPMIGPLPLTTSLGQTQDRAVGFVKGAANLVLDILGMMGAPKANLEQTGTALHLDPSSQNQKFGGEVFGLAAVFMGGGKTGRKVNEKAYEAAKEAHDWIGRVLKRVEALPNKTPELKEIRDRLKRALSDALERMRKSPPHAVRGQGPR